MHLDGHKAPVTALTVSPTGEYLASADDDGVARTWRPSQGQAITAIRLAQPLVDLLYIDATHIVASGRIGHYFLSTLDRAETQD